MRSRARGKLDECGAHAPCGPGDEDAIPLAHPRHLEQGDPGGGKGNGNGSGFLVREAPRRLPHQDDGEHDLAGVAAEPAGGHDTLTAAERAHTRADLGDDPRHLETRDERRAGASMYRPMRMCTSAKFTPAALTLMRTWPGRMGGGGASIARRTSGPPGRVICTWIMMWASIARDRGRGQGGPRPPDTGGRSRFFR